MLLLTTLIGLALAVAYTFVASERWTSDSALIRPGQISLGTYLGKQNAYFRLGDVDFNNARLEEIQNNAFNTFVMIASSRDLQEKFLARSPLFQAQSADKPDAEKDKILNSLVSSSLKLASSTVDNAREQRIAFTANSPKSAQETLKLFLAEANQHTLALLDANLNETIKSRVLLLRQLADTVKLQTEQTRANRIALLKQAAASAHAANITQADGKLSAGGNGSNAIIDFANPDTLFLLGEKNLTAQLHALEQSPVIYPTQYYAHLSNADKLEALVKTPSTGTVYDMTQAPSQPLFRDAPKKRLALALGILVGLFLGIFIVLLRFSVRRKYNSNIDHL